MPGATVESDGGVATLCDSIVALIVVTHDTQQTQHREQTHTHVKQFMGRMQRSEHTQVDTGATFSLLFHCLISQSLNNMHVNPITEQGEITDQARCHAVGQNQCTWGVFKEGLHK